MFRDKLCSTCRELKGLEGDKLAKILLALQRDNLGLLGVNPDNPLAVMLKYSHLLAVAASGDSWATGACPSCNHKLTDAFDKWRDQHR